MYFMFCALCCVSGFLLGERCRCDGYWRVVSVSFGFDSCGVLGSVR